VVKWKWLTMDASTLHSHWEVLISPFSKRFHPFK
jgi:hypothetical protein